MLLRTFIPEPRSQDLPLSQVPCDQKERGKERSVLETREATVLEVCSCSFQPLRTNVHGIPKTQSAQVQWLFYYEEYNLLSVLSAKH